MILNGKGRMLGVFQAFDSTVVHGNVADVDALAFQRFFIYSIAVILCADVDAAGCQVLYRLVNTAMAEFHFIGISTVSQSHELMTEADTKNRFLAD